MAPQALKSSAPRIRCWGVGLWVKFTSIFCIVTTLTFGITASVYIKIHWGFVFSWITLLVAIFMLINVYCLNDTCCYQAGWMIVFSCAILETFMLTGVCLYIWYGYGSCYTQRTNGNWEWEGGLDDCERWKYEPYAKFEKWRTIALIIVLVFGLPLVFLRWFYAFILVRACNLQQRRDGYAFE
ncbi:hypothetical protein AAVH_03313 [Aphelenchoides avenae]|nr:hypothetical protein AAVH_03313 [Aphelenchus avenae]